MSFPVTSASVVGGQLLPCRPHFSPLGLLLLPMLCHRFPDTMLEIQRPLLHLWVHFAVDKHPGQQIALREVAEVFVFFHDAFVDFVDLLEGGVGEWCCGRLRIG